MVQSTWQDTWLRRKNAARYIAGSAQPTYQAVFFAFAGRNSMTFPVSPCATHFTFALGLKPPGT
jgi:hypothetical protein